MHDVRGIICCCLQADNLFQQRKALPQGSQSPPVFQTANQQKARFGIGQLIGPILGAVGCMQRYGHKAEPERGLIETDPFDAVFQQNRDALTRDKTGTCEAVPPLGDAFRHILPTIAVPAIVCRLVLSISDLFRCSANPFIKNSRDGAGKFMTDDVCGP